MNKLPLNNPADSAPERDRPSFLRFLRSQWFLIPIFVLLICELLARMRFGQPQWYAQAEQEVAAHRVDYLFIGSSRVAAAIDVKTFSGIMSEKLGRPIHALNLGMGYSTWIEHVLGLRHLFEIAPDHLKRCVLFIEAPGRTLFMGRWSDPWIDSGQANQILSILRLRDLPLIWHSQAKSIDKLRLTGTYLSGWSILFSRRAFIRQTIMDKGATVVKNLLDKLNTGAKRESSHREEASPGLDLSATGGIRTNMEAVQRNRNRAIMHVEDQIKNQPEITDWNSPVYRELAQLIEKHNGEIILYEIPESSPFRRAYETPIGQRNLQRFEQQFGRMNTILLRPLFSSKDNDFPDLWHLRKSRSPEFAAALARAYIQATSNSLERK